MAVHTRKIHPESFQDILNRYQEYYLYRPIHGVIAVGDTLILQEWDPSLEDENMDISTNDATITSHVNSKGYTGRSCQVTITEVFPRSSWLKPGVVQLGIRLNDAEPRAAIRHP